MNELRALIITIVYQTCNRLIFKPFLSTLNCPDVPSSDHLHNPSYQSLVPRPNLYLTQQLFQSRKRFPPPQLPFSLAILRLRVPSLLLAVAVPESGSGSEERW